MNALNHTSHVARAYRHSPHPTSPVAASIVRANHRITCTNTYPGSLKSNFGTHAKIGDASPSVHAEIACALTAIKTDFPTQNAELYTSDPSCPNCAHAITDMGIRDVYIDRDGFDKDYAARRMDAFENISLPIFEAGGVSVHITDCDQNSVETILSAPVARYDHTIILEQTSITARRPENLGKLIDMRENHFGNPTPFASCIATDKNHTLHTISAMPKTGAQGSAGSEQYSTTSPPLRRLMMVAAREGLKPVDGTFYCTALPTSREFVDFVGGGFTTLHIANPKQYTKQSDQTALKQLTGSRILDVSFG